MTDPRIPDYQARRAALDPTRSFIVQAPAGSGKTELLIQRYLTLLARVEAPEEVIAITFTRKAAGEMRDRILSALHKAHTTLLPDAQHERATWELANVVIARDNEKQWNLVQNPLRLRIQTIDSLCSGLTRQMPLLSRFGAQPEISEQAAEFYAQAARDTLALLEHKGSWSPLVARLITHLDNDLSVAEKLLAIMLARRDQWLRRVSAADESIQRHTLEQALENAVKDALEALLASVPEKLVADILRVACYAAANLHKENVESAIRTCHELVALPGGELIDCISWHGFAELLLTKQAARDKNGWRKKVDARIGFPAPASAKDRDEKEICKAMKESFSRLIEGLAEHQNFHNRLCALRELPPTCYTDHQWDFIDALVQLLPVAVAQLKLVFQEHGCVDYTEISQGALMALGDPDNPTDLALSLDYRIRHLLVDEFQDTSLSQYALLERLTAGWEAGDGRTAFMVGDPMQSIYRFREAEVGLYLKARKHGIGNVPLEPLTLNVNFRSAQGIVDWVNATFAQVLPQTEDIGNGAVTFSASIAFHPPLTAAAVTVHPCLGRDKASEAATVVELIRNAQRIDADGTVAILVRGRSHLLEIVPQLKAAGLRYQAIEIDQLGELPVIRDLLTLTRALLHPADRIAWFALLRAPWCGLNLADLVCLAGDDHTTVIWTLMQDETRRANLSDDGQRRLAQVRDILRISIAQRRRGSLRCCIEGAWMALGGPACVESETSLEDAAMFMALLEEVEEGGDLEDVDVLMERVAKLYAAPDMRAGKALQIMTIHKAKGLEFDTVILPGLGNSPPNREGRLLMWMERHRGQGGNDLLLAPIKEAGSESDPIYRYLGKLEDQKEHYEDGRLLYVAATRAKKRLHVLAHTSVTIKDGQRELKSPHTRSLLNPLWPVLEPEFIRANESIPIPEPVQATPDDVAGTVPLRPIQRLVQGWTLPAAPPVVTWQEHENSSTDLKTKPVFQWVSGTTRHVGTVVHKLLHRIACGGVENWDEARIVKMRPAILNALHRLGVAQADVAEAADKVARAVLNTINHERGQWALSGRHAEAKCEYALTGVINGAVVSLTLDRTFVNEQGIRWIVDYKTSDHEGGDLEGFLDNERRRYQAQMNLYGMLMERLDSRLVRLALYFPLLGGWREWGFDEQ